MNRPTNMSEWAAYINSLSGHPLYSKAVAINCHEFARTLKKERFSMGDVEQIVVLFVRQLRATGTKVPTQRAPWDMVGLAQTDPIARKGPTMSAESAELMALQMEPPAVDDMDMFFIEAEMAD